jgi:hypothetical protein
MAFIHQHMAMMLSIVKNVGGVLAKIGTQGHRHLGRLDQKPPVNLI